MAFKDIYPSTVEPIYPEATSEYLDGLPKEDTFKTPKELADKVPEATLQMLEGVRDAVRTIETQRFRLAYYASVLAALNEDYPEAVSRLSDENQALIKEIAGRSNHVAVDALVRD